MATPTQQYIQLMTKRYHLCLKRLSRPEEVDDHPLEQIQELEHPEFMARFGPSRQADGICDRDTSRPLCPKQPLNRFCGFGIEHPGCGGASLLLARTETVLCFRQREASLGSSSPHTKTHAR